MNQIKQPIKQSLTTEPLHRPAMEATPARHHNQAMDDRATGPQVVDEYPAPKRAIRLVALAEGLTRAGVTRAQYYSMRKKGLAPEPVKLTPGRRGAIRLVDTEIDDWIEALMARRTKGANA